MSSGTMARMKRTAILLGMRRVRRVQSAATKKPDEAAGELDEEDWDYLFDLLTPDKVVIADDQNAYQQFGDTIFSAPQEDLLESEPLPASRSHYSCLSLDFYAELGCRRLNTLVREQYSTSSEVSGSRKAADTRALILERLPLFLHEHTHTKTSVSYAWLNNDKHFIVKTFGKLTVTKTLTFDEKTASKSQDASAVARRLGRGPIELWLAGNDQVDMYE